VIDPDEYLYSPQPRTTLEQLTRLPERIGQVLVPWHHFGSSAHFTQPRSIIGGFTRREAEDPSRSVLGKAIVRRSSVRNLWTHAHVVNGSSVGPDLRQRMKIEPVLRRAPRFNLSRGAWVGYENTVKQRIGSARMQRTFQAPLTLRLRINHYWTMSLQRFVHRHGQQYGSVSGVTGSHSRHKDVMFFVTNDMRSDVEDRALLGKYDATQAFATDDASATVRRFPRGMLHMVERDSTSGQTPS